MHFEVQLPVFRLVTERASHHVEQAGEEDFLRFHGNRSGFDFRQVKNVGDQVQQVRSGAMNRSREFDLLVASSCRRGYR